MSWSGLLAHLQWPERPPPPPLPSPSAPSALLAAPAPPPLPRLIVLQDALSTPCDFVLVAFVWSAVRSGGRVAVVLTQRSTRHCHLIAHKAGWSLLPYESSGSLLWVDLFAPFPPATSAAGLSAAADDARLGAEAQERAAQPPPSPPSPFDLPHLLQRLQRLRAEHGPLHVVIDDLTPLATSPSALPRLHSFLCALQALTGDGVPGSPAAPLCSVLLCGHSDVESMRPLLSLLSSSSDLQLTLSPLSTGASRDVHGALSLVRRDARSGCVTSHSLVHYQLTATGVALFEKGQHSGD